MNKQVMSAVKNLIITIVLVGGGYAYYQYNKQEMKEEAITKAKEVGTAGIQKTKEYLANPDVQQELKEKKDEAKDKLKVYVADRKEALKQKLINKFGGASGQTN